MRKGVELSISFAVILIITLLIFGLGLLFLKNMYTTTKNIQEGFERQTDIEIERLLTDEGSLVAIPFSTAKLKKGESRLFGIGIRNVLKQKQNFQVTIQYDTSLVNKQLVVGDEIAMQRKWLKGLDRTVLTIAPNKFKTTKIFLTVPPESQKGTFYFNVCVNLVPDEVPDESIECRLVGDMPPTGLYSDKMYQISVSV